MEPMPSGPEQPGEGALTVLLPHELSPTPEWRKGLLIVFDALNDGPFMADVECRFAQGDRTMSVSLGLFPGLKTRVVVPLEYLDSERVIPERTPHRFKCVCWGGPLDPGRLTRALLIPRCAAGRARILISPPRLTDRRPEGQPRAERPIADSLHQWAQRDWPGKTASLEQVKTRLTEELLATQTAPPDELDHWGGWKEKQFGGTGFFRTEHDGRRWWLVDPDGCAFYSVGVDCVRAGSDAEADGNEDLFTELPPKEGSYSCFWREGAHGRKTIFDAVGYNLARALGDVWFEEWMEVSGRRMLSWGFNTVGNWSDPRFCRFAGLPYVFQLNDFPTTQKTMFRGFPDVFSDEYVRNSRLFAKQLEPFADDPRVIGYFLCNEPSWAFGTHNLAERMLARPERPCSRVRLVEWLRERYGDLEGLNGSWGAGLRAWDELAEGIVPAEHLTSEAARRDLGEFSKLLIERFAHVPSEECRRVAPNHLNLGVRYAGVGHDDLLAGADAFDVFSINAYDGRPAADVISRCARAVGGPVLIGEFHTGALDRGLPHGGLRTVRTQQDRADSYRYYVEQGAAIPELVGTHYFQWNDQHVVGRGDGENWQIGLVDVCQQPYVEFIAAARRSHARIYRVAAGEMPPFDRLPDALRFG
jgi:hypothetical protein